MIKLEFKPKSNYNIYNSHLKPIHNDKLEEITEWCRTNFGKPGYMTGCKWVRYKVSGCSIEYIVMREDCATFFTLRWS